MIMSLQDELIWGAAWLYRATKAPNYWSYVVQNISNLEKNVAKHTDRVGYGGGSFAEFGWDTKNAGINILVSKVTIELDCSISVRCYNMLFSKFFLLLSLQLLLSSKTSDVGPFIPNADKFVCTVLPESPTVYVSYSPGSLNLFMNFFCNSYFKGISFCDGTANNSNWFRNSFQVDFCSNQEEVTCNMPQLYPFFFLLMLVI